MMKLLSGALCLVFAGAGSAHAFCGFYVGGAGTSLYNDATMVVMMRDGSRTILSMQNSYSGPPEKFAMVIPVPEVLSADNVKTLPHSIFERVDKLAAPRLVEYWQELSCPDYDLDFELSEMAKESGAMPPRSLAPGGVKVEAEFEVAEYDIVILSAEDSTGLDTWLRTSGYNIPQGAEPVLRGYVEQGTKFFVAKVDPEKVKFVDDRAVLSPLRVDYDSETFSLPLRMGLLNSKGQQDLIVHILARNERYEAANYGNTTIPTNLVVHDEVRTQFGAFYDTLFSKTVADNPKSVVTEYSWDAGSCDPCPDSPLTRAETTLLGGDVISNEEGGGFVLTRLHYRYGKDGLDEDIVFKAASALEGGRGTPNDKGELDGSVHTDWGTNMFQGRYAILHPFKGTVECTDPVVSWGARGETQSSGNNAMLGKPPGSLELSSFISQPAAVLEVTPKKTQDFEQYTIPAWAKFGPIGMICAACGCPLLLMGLIGFLLWSKSRKKK